MNKRKQLLLIGVVLAMLSQVFIGFKPAEATSILENLPGDVDGNGQVLMYDASLVSQYIAGLISFTEDQKIAAEVTSDNQITSLDADAIAAYAVQILNSLPIIFGDVSGNGSVSGTDASYVSQYVNGSKTLDSHQKYVADVNLDDEVTSEDADLIAKYVAGIITYLPVQVKPDFIIEDIAVKKNPSDNKYYPFATFKNIGGQAGAKMITIEVMDTGNNKKYYQSVGGGSFSTGYEYELQMSDSLVLNSSGVYNFLAKADYYNTFDEAREDNNSLTKTVNLAPALEIVDTPSASSGTDNKFTVKFKTDDAIVYFFKDGVQIPGSNNNLVGTMYIAGTYSYTFQNLSLGERTLGLKECVAGLNSSACGEMKSVKYTVLGTSTKPDLTVVDLDVKQNMNGDKNYYFWVKYRNNGAASTLPGITFEVKDLATGKIYITPLPVGGGSVPANWEDSIFLTTMPQVDAAALSKGSIKAMVTIDSTKAFDESNENNNTLTKTIAINSPWPLPTCPSGRTEIIHEQPLGGYVYQALGLDISAHPEIMKYRIQWFNGQFSGWYVPGQNDIDWKTNLDGTQRRVWVYFDDHVHEYEKCLPQSSSTCTDSDGGKNYFSAGYVKALENSADTSVDNHYDYCGMSGDEKDKLVEYVCGANDYVSKQIYSCFNGCKDGACIAGLGDKPDFIVTDIAIKTSTTDNKYYAFATFKNVGGPSEAKMMTVEVMDKESSKKYYQSVGGGDFPADYEYELQMSEPLVLNSTGVYNFLTKADYYNIFDESNEDNNSLTKTINIAGSATCTDSDGGGDYYQKGKLTYTHNPYGVTEELDSCVDDYYLKEGVCHSTIEYIQNYIKYYCPNGCRDGACLLPSPKRSDFKLAKRLAGRILLAAYDRGRVYYVGTENFKKHEVTFGNLMSLFEDLALGITYENLNKIPVNPSSMNDKMDSDQDGFNDKAEAESGHNPFGPGRLGPYNYQLANRLQGKILLVVDQGGQIWYVDETGKRWQVTWSNAMNLFMSLALGITNEDLAQIEDGG